MDTNHSESETNSASNVATTRSESPKTDLAYYNRELSKDLDDSLFKPTPMRLAYMGIYIIFNLLLIIFVSSSDSMILKVLAGIAIGIFNAGLAFSAHELLHGGIIKNQKWQDILGFVGFSPFLISPTFWRFWHNRLHHGKTQNLLIDPDCFPTLAVFKRSKFMKWAFPYTPGSGYLRSYSYFFFWFMFQAFLSQTYFRFTNKNFSSLNHKKVTLEFVGMILLFLIYSRIIPLSEWMYLIVIPFCVQNYTVMSYISTNHNISPQTKINDPLANSLSVSTHPLWQIIHMNFGYHTEHHIFPSMSGWHLPKVQKLLLEKFPKQYHLMPKSEALKLIYQSARVYKNADTLIHPETHVEFKTLS